MKDSKGHGSNARGGGNGDPRKEAIQSRFIPGHGVAPRTQVVARHNSTPSVGVSAKAEQIAKGQRIDDTHYPPRSNADVAAMTDRSRPQGSQTATPGRFRYQGGK
ncbi:MAG TPA: hypothetical protein VN742_09645 [Candidatus Binataceae bacterium]|nr:hypothetical protein [Candidatus Binataceae bacterium]